MIGRTFLVELAYLRCRNTTSAPLAVRGGQRVLCRAQGGFAAVNRARRGVEVVAPGDERTHGTGAGNILISMLDGLRGPPDMIEAVPKATILARLVHLVRRSLAHVSYKVAPATGGGAEDQSPGADRGRCGDRRGRLRNWTAALDARCNLARRRRSDGV